MNVLKRLFSDRGLLLKKASNGLSDLRVIIGDKILYSMRCILMNGNETFRKLLEDAEVGCDLVLCEGSSVDGFIEIEKYYSGGSMELRDDNVMKVLLMSIYYNDKEILEMCIKYLKNHLNDEMMLRILELSELLKKEEIFELIKLSEEYLRENDYKYLNNERLLYKLRIENLRIILESENLIIKDETWLLKVLMKWYKNELKNIEDEEEKKEMREEFKILILKSINIDKLRMTEIEEEILNELKMIKIDDYLKEIKNRKKYKCLNDFKVEDVRILELIIKYYKGEEEEEIIRKEYLKELKNENVISMLLKNEDIKLKEIGLLIMIESGIDYKMNKRLKREILIDLIGEYKKESRNNRILKCLCLFVKNEKYVETMKSLCGIRILCELLNYDNYYSKETKEMLIKRINREWDEKIEEENEEDNEEDNEEEMLKLIKNEETKEEIKIKEITSFSYPHSEYLFGIIEEISMIPTFDGNQCKFSISPPLPLGIKIDKVNGIIHGRCEQISYKKEYEIYCKNRISEKKIKISLEFVDIKFSELNKSSGILITNNGNLIIETSANSGWRHCYLNMKMEKGIYHIKYQFHQNGSNIDAITLGLSTSNTYSGNEIYYHKTVCEYYACDGKSKDIVSSICHIGTVVNKNPNFSNHGDGSIYEVIVDMNKREFWISHNNSSPVLLVKDLPSPLFPYGALAFENSSIEFLSFSYLN